VRAERVRRRAQRRLRVCRNLHELLERMRGRGTGSTILRFMNIAVFLSL
jgi:hypothetical protein